MVGIWHPTQLVKKLSAGEDFSHNMQFSAFFGQDVKIFCSTRQKSEFFNNIIEKYNKRRKAVDDTPRSVLPSKGRQSDKPALMPAHCLIALIYIYIYIVKCRQDSAKKIEKKFTNEPGEALCPAPKQGKAACMQALAI